MTSLEHRYRRLLRWYPADHRRRHEDEMLDVLLADASPGQERPDARAVADLLTGAARIRVRRLLGGGWRDGVALVSVLAPTALVAHAVAMVAGYAEAPFLEPAMDTGMILFSMAMPFLVAAAVWRGRARLAMTLAGAMFVYHALGEVHDLGAGTGPFPVIANLALPLTCALALAVPGALDRGRELVRHGRLTRFGLAMTLAYLLSGLSLSLENLVTEPLIVAVQAFWAGRALGSAAAIRAAMLLALPVLLAAPFGSPVFFLERSFDLPLGLLIVFGPALVVFAVTARRTRRRSCSQDPAPDSSVLA